MIEDEKDLHSSQTDQVQIFFYQWFLSSGLDTVSVLVSTF